MKGVPGELVGGRYRIEKQVGTGGFGAVFAGRQINMERRVAIKVMRDGPESPETARERFRREAVFTGGLNHPAIVTYHDFFVDDDGDFVIVMEFLDGATLDEVIASSGRIAVDRAAQLIAGAARGLAEAHRSGIVHRDIKPSNLFVIDPAGPRERIKVIDFGILWAESFSGKANADLTRENAFIGTPEYVAPEVVIGGRPDGRADQYALALVFVRAVTGMKPFPSSQGAAILQRLACRPPAIESEPFVSMPALKGVLFKALTPEPADRFADMDTFADALESALAGGGGPYVEECGPTACETIRRGGVRVADSSADPAGAAGRLSGQGVSAGFRIGLSRIAGIAAAGMVVLAIAAAVWAAGSGRLFGHGGTPGGNDTVVAAFPGSTDAIPDVFDVRNVAGGGPRVTPDATVDPAGRTSDASESAKSPADHSAPVESELLSRPARRGTSTVRSGPNPTRSSKSQDGNRDGYAGKSDSAVSAAVQEPLPSGSAPGYLKANSEPWAVVWIDGRKAGRTPLEAFEIAPGVHRIRFVHPEFGEIERRVNIKSGETIMEFADFSKDAQR